MEIRIATACLSALAQESRLQVFRLLVEAGEEGLPAGEIARAVGVPHNTMSSHLAILQQAGLVQSQRQGRSVIYAVDLSGVRDLLAFLLEDCCQGRREVCAPLLDAVLPACCGDLASTSPETAS
jgi:DNA-binding transcriptional ArsR family regulator